MSTPTTRPSSPAAASAPLTIADLVSYFRGGAKDRARFRIGIEQEKIGITEDGRPIPYDGPRGMSEILE